ncbi:MAG: LysR family transcriptional regulator [Rhodobacteraceae bacterium]|nr:LysR family transcriptional regulator [Paracoccaceae bacterium]
MDELRPIRIFLAVADQLSFSGAARVLNLTPATVTRTIATLEGDLGAQLLLRTTRAVSLTADGAAIAARYRPILEEFDAARVEISASRRPDKGRLRINAPLSLGLRLMPQVVEAFRLAYPAIELDLHLTDAFVDIMEADCDLAIRVSGPPSDVSTIWRKLCEVPRHAVAAPALFERVPEPIRPEDIDPAIALSYSETGAAETWTFTKGAAKRVVTAGTGVVSNNGDLLYGLARAGVGITVLPDFLVEPGVASGEVQRVLPDWDLPALWLTLYYPPYVALPPLVATFSTFFEDYLRQTNGLTFLGPSA